MSLRNKLFSISAVAATVFVFSNLVSAQATTTPPAATDKTVTTEKSPVREYGKRKFGKEGGHGHHMGPGGRGMAMLRGIDLTEAQKIQLKSIFEANKPDPETMQEIKTLAMVKRDGTITGEQQTRLTALKAEAKEKGRAVHAQIEAILTPEQKAQIETKKQEMKQRIQQRRQQRQQKTPAPAAPIEK